MVIEITKAQDKSEAITDTSTKRYGPDDYEVSISFRDFPTINKLINISKTKKLSFHGEVVPNNLTIDEPLSIKEMSAIGEESIPVDLGNIFDDAKVKTLIETEKKISDTITFSVVSEHSQLLEINWSKLLASCTNGCNYVHVRSLTNVDTKSPTAELGLNTLMLLSYSNEDFGQSLHPIYEHFAIEARDMLALFFKHQMRSGNKPNVFTIARYINRESIQKVSNQGYDILHISAHGQPRKIGLEEIEDSGKIEWFDPDQIQEFRNVDNKYSVVFLSICNGANNIDSLGSTAFELIKKGFSKSVIAFRDGAGSEHSLPSFTKTFYDLLYLGKSVEESFYETAKFIYQDRTIHLLPIYYKAHD